jgi:mannitol 2-dehydrogenase
LTLINSSTVAALPQTVGVPSYARHDLEPGIVHFGVGGFHRAHQAMYVDRILNAGNREWSICGVGVLPSDVAMRDVLAAQDNLYTLVTRAPDGTAEARVIGSITQYLFAPDDTGAVLAKLVDPRTRIVSLTITEGGYSINDATGEFEPRDAATLADLSGDGMPASVLGFIVAALRARRAAGDPPFTVMSCDNIQSNGEVTRKAVTGFASLQDPDLAGWIAQTVAFPNSMVDRITPATTDEVRRTVADEFGLEDQWPVSAEAFEQWVLEDHFTMGRPPFETVGVQMVDDVEPYELMKLRLLNASHQAIGHLGLLAGESYVHDVCRDPAFARFLLAYMRDEAAPTLKPVPGVDLVEYTNQLIARFSSEAIRDTLERLVTDASDRIPKFLLPVVRSQLERGGDIRRSTLVVAAWSIRMEAEGRDGVVVPDRRHDELRAAAEREAETPGAFLNLPDVFGSLTEDPEFVAQFTTARRALLGSSVHEVFERLESGQPVA